MSTLPPLSAEELYVYAACSDSTSAWFRFGLPSSVPEESRGSVSTTWLSLSEMRCDSVFIMATAWVPPPLSPAAAALSLVRASSPVALRAGSAAPSLSASSRRVAPASSIQLYVFCGHPRDFAAVGTIATPMGVEAMSPAGVTSTALLPAVIRSIHMSESGTHNWASVFLPAASVSATLYAARAVTVSATHWPSEVMLSSWARFAAAVSAGAMSGAAARSRRTGSSWHEEPNESSPPLTAPAVPPATVRTSTVAMATVRRRARGRGSLPPAPY